MNIFLVKFKDKSHEELESILKNEAKYDEKAVEAARELLNSKVEVNSKSTNVFVFSTDSDSLPQLRYFGYAGIFAGIAALFTNEIMGAIIAIISIIIVAQFRSNKLVLDLNNKTVTPNTLFGSEPKHFDKIDRLVIKLIHVNQQLNSRGSKSVIRYQLFQAFLISGKTKILLGEARTKKPLTEQLKKVSKISNAPICDKT